MKKLLLLLAVASLLSCASIQRSQDIRSMENFSQLINAGKAGDLIGMSAVPFLLDREIIVLDGDIETLWNNIVAAGYTVDEPELERGVAVIEESYLEFNDSMEVKVFFEKYAGKKARLLELKTSSGQRLLLLFELTFGGRQIRGFKGPY